MISIVIPVYNEAESLPQLHSELRAVAKEHGYRFDIIMVDDGSRDDSWAVIQDLARRDPQLRGIRFRRNFGKAAALSAGFQAARGEILFTLDADLQDDPHEIPNFLEKMEEGFDVVSGWKQVRHDPWHKVGPSRIFNRLVGAMTGVRLHDHNCGFKCYRREIFDEVRLYGELHRFVPVLAAARGWRVSEIPVNHRARQHGHSKYGAKRMVKGFLDLLTVYFLTGFGQRPQHLLGGFGLVCFSLGGLCAFYLSLGWIWTRLWALGSPDAEVLHLHERALFFYALTAVILGAQFMLVGFLAEMVTFYAYRDTRPYSVNATVGDRPHALEEDLLEHNDPAEATAAAEPQHNDARHNEAPSSPPNSGHHLS